MTAKQLQAAAEAAAAMIAFHYEFDGPPRSCPSEEDPTAVVEAYLHDRGWVSNSSRFWFMPNDPGLQLPFRLALKTQVVRDVTPIWRTIRRELVPREVETVP